MKISQKSKRNSETNSHIEAIKAFLNQWLE